MDEDESDSESDPEADGKAGRSRHSNSSSSALGQPRVRKRALKRQLQALMHLPLVDAAAAMGCANKAKFRELYRWAGIQRWPSNKGLAPRRRMQPIC